MYTTKRREFPNAERAWEFQQIKSTIGHNTKVFKSQDEEGAKYFVFYSPVLIDTKNASEA